VNDFFHGPHGASRSYLFSKVFLLLLALDAWALMIGHAGRYGAAGFNAAHFDWLDAIQPLPTNASYIGVLLLAGLLSLTLMLTGISRWLLGLLLLLYSYSWAMSLLDSYQHHYFVSLILACMVFFPKLSARDIHPLLPRLDGEQAKKKRARERERLEKNELLGWVFTALAAVIVAIYAAVDNHGRVFTVFFLCAGALAACTWFVAPKVSAAPRMTRAFGWNLLGVTVSLVYLYTAIAKLDPTWLAGFTMQRIGRRKKDLASLVELAAGRGISSERFWALISMAVIPQELFMAAAYLCAVLREQQPSRLLDVICWLAVGLGVALHVGAEALGLEIGWFSHYMLLFAATYLLPLPIVDRLAIVLTWPGRYLSELADSWEHDAPSKAVPVLTVLGGAAAVMTAAYFIDLPGAVMIGALASVGLIGLAAVSLARGGADPRRWGIATAAAAVLMWIAIAASPVRWDYYRFRAGDLDKRGELEAALDAYEHGERYAPAGESRKPKIEQLRRKLNK
jgi:hypothetical protein